MIPLCGDYVLNRPYTFFDIPCTNTCDVRIFCGEARQEAVLRFTVQNNGPARENPIAGASESQIEQHKIVHRV